MKQSQKTLLLWTLLFLMVIAVYQLVSHGEEPQIVSFSDFVSDIKKGSVTRVEIRTLEQSGEYTYWIKGAETENASLKKITYGILGEQLQTQMLEQNIEVKYLPEDKNSFWAGVLMTWLPMILLVVFFVIFMRQLQASGGKAMSFGKSRAKLLNESKNKITFDDVAGIEEAKDDCEEIIAFLKDPKKFQKLGGRIPKGVLLVGAPGTGKTLLAKAIAGEAAVPFFSISGSDFVEMFVGVGASRVRDLFEQGRKSAPCIVFIDEIDAVGRHRGAGMGGGHDEREQTLNQLLVEMDGFDSSEGVLIIAATNRADVLDPALLRPGRFDRRIHVPRPDLNGRIGILQVHTKKVPLSSNVDLEIIARGTPGFSGADLENLVNEAALLAARQDKNHVDMVDFEMAKDKVLMGPERRSMVINEEEKKVTAWHEAGHTLVAALLPNHDPIHKVSIIPRGPALGVTMSLPKEDRHSYSKEWVLDRIAMALGGRIAEEVVFSKVTTGAADDFKKATELARSMVTEWGMSEALGTLAYGSHDESSSMFGPGFREKEYSEETARKIDEEVRHIIQSQFARSKELLEQNREKLDALAEALLERETLDYEEVKAILEGRSLPPRQIVSILTYSEKKNRAQPSSPKNSIFQPRPGEAPYAR